MGWTRRQLIEEAFGELALAGYDFDLTPEEMQAAARRLDAMMATWAARGVNVGFAVNMDAAAVDLDADSGLQMVATEAAYMGLAVRLAASKGKQLGPQTKTAAKDAYDALVSRIASGQVQEQQLPSGTPRGAGRKPWRTVNQPFFVKPTTDPLRNGEAGELIFAGKTD